MPGINSLCDHNSDTELVQSHFPIHSRVGTQWHWCALHSAKEVSYAEEIFQPRRGMFRDHRHQGESQREFPAHVQPEEPPGSWVRTFRGTATGAQSPKAPPARCLSY